MYQAYPGGTPSEPSRPSAAPAAPPSITRAVRIMYAGAAASLIGIGVDFAAIGSLRSRIASSAKPGHPLTAVQITDAEHFAIGLYIFFGLVSAAAWLWMARSCGAGKRWARTLSSVLFGVGTIIQFLGLYGLSGAPGRIFGLVVWLIGLAAIVFLWRRESSGYFRAAPQ